jgi:predicted membrane-bound dolichyl-phosphate-mannose-protein mannosyltransferase
MKNAPKAIVTEVRTWMLSKISIESFVFPNEDEVWEYITTKHPRIKTDIAESILIESMKDIEYKDC